MSLYSLNTPAFPAPRYATLLLGVVGLVALNVLVVLFTGAFVHHYDIGLRWLIIAAVVTGIGFFPARFAAQQLWQWVAGTTALNGPGNLFAKSAASLGPCILAGIALYVVATGKYVGSHIPLHLQGMVGSIFGVLVLLGLVICLQELASSIRQRRATA